MKSPTYLVVLAALLLFSLTACEQPLSVSTDGQARVGGSAGKPEAGPGLSPAQTDPDPEAHFFFLPPLAVAPAYTGTFAFGLEPLVRVSLQDSAGLVPLVEFSTSGSGSERVRLESSEDLGDYYMVNFHLKRFAIPLHANLLIEVLVEGKSIGALPAVTIADGSEKTSEAVSGLMPLVQNRTVPIKFRIEEEYFVPDSGSIEVWLATNAPEELLDVPEFDDFIAVAAGSYHAVGLRADGSLVSWGRDTYGSVLNTPAGTGFVAVDAGLLYSMALHEDGTVYAWGGGLAYDAADRPTGSGFTDIAAGYAFALAITSTGGLTGWSLSPAILTTLPAGTDYTEIKASQGLAAAIDEAGQLVLFGLTTSVLDAEVPAGEYLAVDTGDYHAAGVLSDGRLVSWGGPSAVTYGLVQDLSDGPYVSVAAGERLGLGLRADGTLRPYGNSLTAASITPADGAEYFAVAVSPIDSAFAIRRVSE